MAKLNLRRFSTLENYQNADIVDGTFFVIVESGQLGVRKGEVDVLTPPNTLYDYKLPDGEIVITQNDTIAQAIAKLEKKTNDFADEVEATLNAAEEALDAVRNVQETEGDEWKLSVESRLSELSNRIEVLSEEEFAEMVGFDRNRVYYIYEND